MMQGQGRARSVLLGCASAVILIAASGAANAGGFALREQSAFGQGSSFAGVAAGGDLSTMFWNPATMTQAPGIQVQSVVTGVIPYASNSPSAGSTLFALGGTGDIGNDALVPAGYMSWQLNPNLWLGMSFNAPFGLGVSFPTSWAGRDYGAGDSHLRTYNATPSIAYKINNWISVGAGVQIQYADAGLSKGISGVGLTEVGNIAGTGWAYGFTAGVTLTPTPNTTIGLGYRSGLNQDLEGTFNSAPVPLPFNGSASTSVKLPDVVSLGIRQRVSPQWTLLGTVEWTNWSRIGTSTVTTGTGVPFTTLPFQYDDGWFFSLGAEYQWTDRLAVRAGLGYEKSPITDDVRIPLLPDNDRIWLSVGASYKITSALTADIAYSHIFVKDSPINIVPGTAWFGTAGVAYIGNVDAHVDIISLALKYRWDEPAVTPVKQMYVK